MITITASTEAFGDALAELQRRLGNLSQPMRDIGAALETSIRTRRETHKDPSGSPWEAWSPSYEANYYHRRPGEGALREKLLERTGDMWEGPTWKAGSSSVRVGFDQPYSTFHEFGTNRMPRRGLLFADPEKGELGIADEQAVTDVLQDWLDGIFD